MNADAEIDAIQTALKAFETLDEEGRRRGLAYLQSRLRLSSTAKAEESVRDERRHHDEPTTSTGFKTFAELFEAAQPNTNGDKALVAAYWLQNDQSESWDSQSANKLLKDLGHGLINITKAFDGLKAQKPALVLQLKKSGTSQQARKIYKVTKAGLDTVEAMIRG